MYEFTYHRPGSVADAVKLLADPDARAMSGGMTLIPTLKQRLARPTAVVDLSGIGELKGITVSGGTVKIGGMTTHATVASSADVAKAIPALAKLAAHIGDAQVRNRGTMGGSVANHDPAADYPGAVLALGATVHTNTRAIAADDFFNGMFSTALEPGEIVTAISFPVPEKAAYVKFPNPASRYAMVGVFVAKGPAGVRVAVTGAGANGVFRHAAMEAALAKNWSAAALDGVTTPVDDLNGDIHASKEYRAHLIGVMAKRAVAAAG
ncbi:xanthine dehydrogenase family protein subunit M [Elioraea sp.]|uniref:FAD binding domain-containing protein n=1 Tax=Elioraea sp. TaxID=2185103 RepID=UPI0025C0C575|nr:xanthine dehydrogenase family protein subunit M [Elioraea sp.]